IQATESALQLAIELKVDIIAVQEPWNLGSSQNLRDFTGSNRRSISHRSFTQILPEGNIRPRVMLYAARELQAQISTSPSFPTDPDCLLLSIRTRGLEFQLLNVQPKTIVLGDFNTYHPLWDSFCPTSSNASFLAEWFEDNNLELLNTPGEVTFCRTNQRESVLDLTLMSQDLADKVEDWNVLKSIGSDHHGILFTVKIGEEECTPSPVALQRFNTQKADWEKFRTKVQEYMENSHFLE
ncbi:DNase I-like protein, partial [Aulographum hederae CBS 113979]